MKKEDFSDVFLYTTIVDDDTVYVDKNVLHVHEGYNFMTADGRYVDAFFDNGSAIDIHGTFVIVDYDNDDIRLSGALLNGEPVLLIGNPELAEARALPLLAAHAAADKAQAASSPSCRPRAAGPHGISGLRH